MKSDKTGVFSPQTRNNFLLDIGLLAAGLASILSGIYFLFLPVGGYQGGRNPSYGLVLLFERHTWSDLHTWASVAIIGLAALHIPIHWSWITRMARSGWKTLRGRGSLSKGSQFNLGVNLLIGLSGLVCAISGLYFLFEPLILPASSQDWLFSRLAWDLIHTWSGVAVTAAAILHFAIHWRWVVKVVGKYWRVFRESLSGGQQESAPGEVRVPAERVS